MRQSSNFLLVEVNMACHWLFVARVIKPMLASIEQLHIRSQQDREKQVKLTIYSCARSSYNDPTMTLMLIFLVHALCAGLKVYY